MLFVMGIMTTLLLILVVPRVASLTATTSSGADASRACRRWGRLLTHEEFAVEVLREIDFFGDWKQWDDFVFENLVNYLLTTCQDNVAVDGLFASFILESI